MCIANNPYVSTKPNSVRREMPDINPSPPKRARFGFLFMDCCSFLGVGLNFDDDIPPCASIALMDDDDSISEVSQMRADTPVFSRGALKNQMVKNEEDTKTAHTSPTMSTLTMEKFAEMKKAAPAKQEDEEIPLKLLLLSENLVSGERVYDEIESLTLNTMSATRIPSSLDTRTEKLPPSLDTKTLSRALEGLKLVETTGEDTRTREDTGRNFNKNRPCSRSRNLYDIERVPSLIDTHSNDNRSVVSAISADSGAPLSMGVKAKEPIRKRRLFKGKGKILRGWSWKNKRARHEPIRAKVPSVSEEPPVTIPTANEVPNSPNKSSMPLVTTMKPTKQSVPSPVPRHVAPHVPKSPPRIRREYPTASPPSTVPVIKATKSNDITASTTGTDEEDRDNNVPFDEPANTFSPPRFQSIEKIRVGRYLRPSSNIEIRDI